MSNNADATSTNAVTQDATNAGSDEARITLSVDEHNDLTLVVEADAARLTATLTLERVKQLRELFERHIYVHTHYNVRKEN